jgi:hypothetical protein
MQGLTPSSHLGGGSLAPAAGISQSGLDEDVRLIPGSAEDVQAELALGSPSLVPSTSVGGQAPLASAVATGPLPERAVAPLGGVLAEGDPVPQLDRHDPAMVDLALIGLPDRAVIAGAHDADLEAIVAERERAQVEADGPIALRSPGGLPFLTDSLQGGQKVDAATLLAALPPASTSTAVVVPHAAETNTALEALPAPRRIAPASVMSGVTAAMAMVFGLILPGVTRLMSAPAGPRLRLRLRFRRPTHSL